MLEAKTNTFLVNYLNILYQNLEEKKVALTAMENNLAFSNEALTSNYGDSKYWEENIATTNNLIQKLKQRIVETEQEIIDLKFHLAELGVELTLNSPS
jgi:hypothetical protein